MAIQEYFIDDSSYVWYLDDNTIDRLLAESRCLANACDEDSENDW